MSDERKARLSALMDGEAEWCPEDLAYYRDDPEAAESWQGYHLIRDVLQEKHHVPNLGTDTATAVMNALKDESPIFAPAALAASLPEIDQPASQTPEAASAANSAPEGKVIDLSRYFKPVMGFAVAASVAMASFVLVQSAGVDSGVPAVAPVAVSPTQPSAVSLSVANAAQPRVNAADVGLVSDNALNSAAPLAAKPAINTIGPSQFEALERYTLQHMDQEASFSLTGTLPASRLVTHAPAQ